jgi:hypothetical protein
MPNITYKYIFLINWFIRKFGHSPNIKQLLNKLQTKRLNFCKIISVEKVHVETECRTNDKVLFIKFFDGKA